MSNKSFNIKYCIIHYLIKPIITVITIYIEDIKAAIMFKDNNCELDHLFIHMEVAV